MLRLAADIGNTRAKIALMQELEIVRIVAIPKEEYATPERWGAVIADLLLENECRVAAVSSVVPVATETLETALRVKGINRIVRVNAASVDRFRIVYDPPESLGADRLAGVIAARALYGFPSIVIDFGTATTMNVLDAHGDFIGGSIGLGLDSTYRALHANTAQLPLLASSNLPPTIGSSTSDAIQAGVVYPFLDGVQGLLGRMRSEIGDSARVIITGGNAGIIRSLIPDLGAYEPHLVVKGCVFTAKSAAQRK